MRVKPNQAFSPCHYRYALCPAISYEDYLFGFVLYMLFLFVPYCERPVLSNIILYLVDTIIVLQLYENKVQQFHFF